MAMSGTISTTKFNTNAVIDHAFRRCRVSAQRITAEMQDLLDKRAKARVEKNWKLSDELRNQLNKLGVEVKDTENGQELAVISD